MYLKNLAAPALSWDTMLSMIKVELDLISDVNMYMFVEKGMETVFLIFLNDRANQKTDM